MYHQRQGGPIGLRGTCAIARMAMQLFDIKWGEKLRMMGITTWLNFRYVDDSRSLLPPIKAGWRWRDNQLIFTKRWELEDRHVSGEHRTKEILKMSMMGVKDYLSFTVESGEEYEGGWLPTLDVSLRVEKDNSVQFKFYEKATCSKKTVQKDSAMEENSKIQTVSNDLVRRLSNTRGSMGADEQCKVVDGYAQKLVNSGYQLDQVRKILVNGIKGFEGRKARCAREGRKLYRTAKESMGARYRKKLLAKTCWYKGARSRAADYYQVPDRRNTKRTKRWEDKKHDPMTVLFIEQTPMGELGRRLRELMSRLAPILGFSVKIVERTGSSLKSHFPQSNLWDGAPCGRPKCVTCTQGAEMLPPCTRKSLVYENVCSTCNPEAGAVKELENVDPTIPSIYVGETARTVQERAREHWAAAKGKSKKEVDGSHMWKHMEQYHGGGEPTFIMRVVQFHRSALSRQTGEAVRIMRRGGAGSVLNSRSEFNRCYIPRLKVEEQEKLIEMEEQEQEELVRIRETLREEDMMWEQDKKNMRAERARTAMKHGSSAKRPGIQQGAGRRKKRLKYSVVEDDWGCSKEEKTTPIENPEAPVGSKDVRDGSDKPGSQLVGVGAGHPQSEGATDQPPDKSSSRAALPPRSSLTDGSEVKAYNLTNTGTDEQLHSPRCNRQTSIESFFHPMRVEDGLDGGGGDRSFDGGTDITVEGDKGMLETDYNIEIPECGPDISSEPAPSVSNDEELALNRMCEDEGDKEDICSGGKDSLTNECDIRKRLLWCNTHECDVKSVKDCTKNWQWNKNKMKFMWMYKSVKRYICPGMKFSQVQPMVSEASGGKKTKPEPIFERCNKGLEKRLRGQQGERLGEVTKTETGNMIS